MVRLLDNIPYSSIPTASLGELTPISCYSEYHNGVVQYGSTATLRQFVKPRMSQDLAVGYDVWVAQHSQIQKETKPFGIKSLDFLIEACLRSDNPDVLLSADVVTKRGILSRFALALDASWGSVLFFSDFLKIRKTVVLMYHSIMVDCSSKSMTKIRKSTSESPMYRRIYFKCSADQG
jgi:hypothetical protein